MNKVEKLFLYITSTLLFLSMFIMGFSSVCHAEGSGNLPYVVDIDNWTNYDGYSISDLQEFYDNRWGVSYPCDFSVEGVIVKEYIETIVYYGQPTDFYFTNILVPLDNTSYYYFENWSDVYSQFDYNSDYCTLSFNNYESVTFSTYRNQYNDPSLNARGGRFSMGIFYNNFYPSYVKGDFYNNTYINSTFLEGDNLVLCNPKPSFSLSGHATEPTNDPNNFINGQNGQPVTRPTSPTINNYTWNTWTSPTIDTSSVETLLESLIDVVKSLFSWLGSNISGEFNNLISNIQNLFDFLVQSIEYGFNKVIKSIQDLATDLYNNFVSLFQPILDGIIYITSPVDTDLIQSEIESTSLLSDYSEVVSLKDSFVSVFTDTSEPTTFTIPIHLENLSMLNVGTQYIDLSVINPVKSALRTFIWVLVSFGLVVTIIDSIPNYINGGGDE